MRIFTALRLAIRSFVFREEFAQYLLSERICGLIYPKYRFSEFARDFLEDREFLADYELFGTDNYHSLDRKYALWNLLLLTEALSGDTAECGVLEGASSLLICKRTAGQGKPHHVFDSFEGLSAPGPRDGTYWTKWALACAEEAVRRRLAPFPWVVYHPGWIPSRFPDVADRTFSFVHVDVDLYQPTLDSLSFFYGRLQPGGVLLCDDYGFTTCPGARQAMDEFFQDKPEKIVALPTGQGFVQKR